MAQFWKNMYNAVVDLMLDGEKHMVDAAFDYGSSRYIGLKIEK